MSVLNHALPAFAADLRRRHCPKSPPLRPGADEDDGRGAPEAPAHESVAEKPAGGSRDRLPSVVDRLVELAGEAARRLRKAILDSSSRYGLVHAADGLGDPAQSRRERKRRSGRRENRD